MLQRCVPNLKRHVEAFQLECYNHLVIAVICNRGLGPRFELGDTIVSKGHFSVEDGEIGIITALNEPPTQGKGAKDFIYVNFEGHHFSTRMKPEELVPFKEQKPHPKSPYTLSSLH